MIIDGKQVVASGTVVASQSEVVQLVAREHIFTLNFMSDGGELRHEVSPDGTLHLINADNEQGCYVTFGGETMELTLAVYYINGAHAGKGARVIHYTFV